MEKYTQRIRRERKRTLRGGAKNDLQFSPNTRTVHIHKRDYVIPNSVLLEKTRYNIATDLDNTKDIPRGAFSVVIFYRATGRKKEIALKCMNFSQLSAQRKKNVQFELEVFRYLSKLLKKKKYSQCKSYILTSLGYVEKTYQIFGAGSGQKVRFGYIVLPRMEHDLEDWIDQGEQGIPSRWEMSVYQKYFSDLAPQFAKIIKYVLEALLCLHEMKIIYHDLKPENILINTVPGQFVSKSSVKVADFNCVRMRYTQAGRCATPAFTSPEQVLGTKITSSTDMWSLGVVSLELITLGRYGGQTWLFEAEDVEEIKRNIIDTRITPEMIDARLYIPGSSVFALPSALARHWSRFIFRCLQHDSKERITVKEALALPLFK